MLKAKMFISFVSVIIIGGLSYYAYDYFKPLPTYTVREVTTLETLQPELTYAGAYNGPLFASSEKTGSEADFEKLFENMDRNGVNQAVLYFGYEANEALGVLDDELEGIIEANKLRPGRIITYYSTGVGGQSEGEMAGEELTDTYRRGYEDLQDSANGLVKGIGEIEIYAWQMPHNDPRILQLFDFASENNLNIMLHPSVGKLTQLEDILKKYPNTTFIMHMFQPDFRIERQNVIRLLQNYSNLYYTIDADHLMFDNEAKIGLLYKYQDVSVEDGKAGFLRDYSAQADSMLAVDLELFSPMVEAVPDKVVWGTEMHNEYVYEAEVYDRMIELSRRFIGSFDVETQEKLAYKNAEKIFGKGVKVEDKLNNYRQFTNY